MIVLRFNSVHAKVSNVPYLYAGILSNKSAISVAIVFFEK